MLTAPQQHCSAGLPAPSAMRMMLDVLVVNAGDLIGADGWTRTIQRINYLARRTSRTIPEHRGPWLLVMTHTRQEREQAYQLTLVLSASGECQGVRAVVGRDGATTRRAALAFHRMHFPAVRGSERSARILVLGSAVDRALFPD
jgi:hypothetical protein